MEDLIFGTLRKTISFRRLAAKNVLKYEIYAEYKDDSYTSGKRIELLDTIENPKVPEPIMKRITLEYNSDATWKLPEDTYLDRDHQFRLYLDGFILSSMYYAFNRISRLITIDTVTKDYTPTSVAELEYYQDIITKTYMLEDDCIITIKPIFANSDLYGFHNVII